MMKILTIDCEIVEQLEPKDPRWNKPAELTISCLGLSWQRKAEILPAWWVGDEDVREITRDDRYADKSEVQHYLDTADLVISFNGERFDFPLMEGAGFDVSHAREVSYDIMAEFVKAARHRISLDVLAKSLVGRGKSGTGSLAPQLWRSACQLVDLVETERCLHKDGVHNSYSLAWQEGAKYLFQAVISYCLDDVALTREVFDSLVDINGEVTYFNQSSQCDRTVMLDLPDGFGSGPPADGVKAYPRVGNWFFVASDAYGVVSMLPTCAADSQIADWRVRHKGCQISEELVDDDKIVMDFTDIPF